MGEVLEHLGVRRDVGRRHRLDRRHDRSRPSRLPYELVRRMRASIVVLGPLLARCGRARVAMPGGDEIGSRPIDLHSPVSERMGADDRIRARVPRGAAPRGLRGAVDHARLPERRRDREPDDGRRRCARHHRDRQRRARARDRRHRGDAWWRWARGSRERARARSRSTGWTRSSRYRARTIPDRIEAGTWAAAAVATRGDVTIEEARADHLDLFLSKLADAGADVARIGRRDPRRPGRPRAGDRLRDAPVPGCGHRLPADPHGDARDRRRAPASPPRTCSRAGSCTSTSCGGWAPTSAPKVITR